MMEEVRSYLKDIKLGEEINVEALRPLLTNKAIFGVDLYEVGLAERVCEYFKELCAGVGAVRATLVKYVG